MGEANNGSTAAPGAAQAEAATAAAEGTQGQTTGTGTPGAGAQGGQSGADNPIKAAAAEALRKHKLKVDGQEIEVDDDELKRGYTHQRAANKKLQEGLKARKQAEDFITAMKNPETLVNTLFKLGYDKKQVRDLSEKFLAGELEEEMMDPRDKKARDTQKKLDDYERRDKEQKAQQEKEHQDKLKRKYADEYSKEFIAALEGSGLPATKDMVADMARYIARAAKIKMPMTAQEAATLVKQDVETKNKHLFSNLKPEDIVKIVGEEGLKKLRDFDVSRLRNPNSNLQTPTEQADGNGRKTEAPKPRMTPSQWRAFNRK